MIREVRQGARALDVAAEGRLLQRCVVGEKGKKRRGTEDEAGVALRREGWGLWKDTRRGLEQLPEGGEGELQVGKEKV